jgi:curli biogenesis system outer membrane secretion channel CsgG
MVVDFDTSVTGIEVAREMATGKIISRLRRDGTFRVLPRDQVQAALQKAKIDTVGYLDIEEAMGVAKTLQADYVLMGAVDKFEQQQTGGCLPIVGCLYTVTATVSLQGKVLDAQDGVYVGEPKARVTKRATSGTVSISIGPLGTPVPISVGNLDQQLIGKAADEAVEQFVADLKKYLRP